MDSTSQATKIYRLIKNNKRGIANYELARISLKYSSRISELRQEGHNIVAQRVWKDGRWTGTWLYYLIEEKPSLLKRFTGIK